MKRPVCKAAVCVAAAMVAGCGTHGSYTGEHLSAAKTKMNGLKAATEYQMAMQAFKAGDLQKALKHVDYSLTLNENVPKSHVLKGRIFLEMNDLEKSTACLQMAQQVDANNIEAEYYLGVLCERVARKEEAMTHYQRAATLDQANAQYCIAAAEMMIDLGKTEEAEAYLNERSQQFINNAGVKQVLGNVAMLKHDTVAAERLFDEARLLAPEDQTIAENLVRAQMANRKFAEADSNLTKMLENKTNEQRRDLKHMHAKCLGQLDRPVEARAVYLELTRDQNGQADAQAWKGLGETAYVLRDMARVKVAAQRLVAIAPQSPDGYVLRGLLNRQNGELQAALSNFQQAAKLAKTPENLVLLGMTQQDLSLIAAARTSYQEAIKLDPQDQSARRLLAGIGE